MKKDTASSILEGLVGYAYPVVEPIGNDGRRFRRRWIIRCSRDMPPQDEAEALGLKLAARAEAVLRETYSGHASEDQLRNSIPAVELVAAGAQHGVVAIEAPTPSHAVGDAAGIGTWVVLRGIDDALVIEDLQGLPKNMWFQLR